MHKLHASPTRGRSRHVRALLLLAAGGVLVGCGRTTAESSSSGTGQSAPSADGGLDATFPSTPTPSSLPGTPGTPGSASAAASQGGSSSGAGAPTTSAPAPAATTAAPTGPAACGLTPCQAGQPCPDLAVDQNALTGSVVLGEQQFDESSCALAEGCILATGVRRLLKFDTATMNIGDADLHVGDPTKNACFTFSQCHQHYHFRGVGRYTLYQQDGKTVAAVGHKQGFCVDDTYPAPASGVTPKGSSTQPFDCNDQGLHVGYEDVYPSSVDCQWIDITDVPAGTYVLSVVINGDHYLPESDYTNNEARVQVTIPQGM